MKLIHIIFFRQILSFSPGSVAYVLWPSCRSTPHWLGTTDPEHLFPYSLVGVDSKQHFGSCLFPRTATTDSADTDWVCAKYTFMRGGVYKEL